MKKIFALICSLSLLSGFADGDEPIADVVASTLSSDTVLQERKITEVTPKSITEINSEPTKPSVPNTEAESDNSVHQIQIAVGDQNFPAVLYKNEATDALMERLPLTLNMGDLNGNEKFYYFSDSLPVNSERPSEIHAGDLMLYGSDCLVLFYESFSSSFSYTSLGYIEDADGLASALGNGNISVQFLP